ncbi:hypothetical protein [Methanofollis ethanolicus]|nr:hypothetical protein [Methanofollis ethanolicus]
MARRRDDPMRTRAIRRAAGARSGLSRRTPKIEREVIPKLI